MIATGMVTFFGAGDDADCDDDTVPDIRVECFTQVENSPGEAVVLNQVQTGVFQGSLTTSVVYDVPGVLFGAQLGNALPVVTCRYNDIDDGTGQSVCANAVFEEAQGLVEVDAAIVVDTGRILIRGISIGDNGDQDGFADENETVSLTIEAFNNSDEPLTNTVGRLATVSGDPDIDCVLDTFVFIGDLAPRESRLIDGDAFVIRVADNVRLDPASGGDGDTVAELAVTFSADQFAASLSPTILEIDLDLDATGGGTPSTFSDSFETGDLGSFTTMALDAGRGNFGDPDFSEAFALSDGFRCQYHDPEWIGGVSFGVILDCFLNPTNLPDEFFWQASDQRAFSGLRSLYYGIELGPDNYTTPFAKLSAVRSLDPIDLGYDSVCSLTRLQTCDDDSDCPGGESCVFASPRLGFFHQVSLINNRAVGSGSGESAEVGIVQVQEADETGAPAGTGNGSNRSSTRTTNNTQITSSTAPGTRSTTAIPRTTSSTRLTPTVTGAPPRPASRTSAGSRSARHRSRPSLGMPRGRASRGPSARASGSKPTLTCNASAGGVSASASCNPVSRAVACAPGSRRSSSTLTRPTTAGSSTPSRCATRSRRPRRSVRISMCSPFPAAGRRAMW